MDSVEDLLEKATLKVDHMLGLFEECKGSSVYKEMEAYHKVAVELQSLFKQLQKLPSEVKKAFVEDLRSDFVEFIEYRFFYNFLCYLVQWKISSPQKMS